MDFEQFQQQIIEEMRDRFPDLHIDTQEVTKLQGQSYTGMSVRPEGSNMAATLNLKPFFEQMESGVSMGRVTENIAQTVAEVSSNMPQVDMARLTNYEEMKSSLTMQLIPTAGNELRLSEIPHQEIEDMSLVYRFELESSDRGTSSALVTSRMLETLGVTPEQLHADALEAAPALHPASLRNMNDVMRDMMGDMGGLIPDEPSPMWVATIEGGQNGACAIQYGAGGGDPGR